LEFEFPGYLLGDHTSGSLVYHPAQWLRGLTDPTGTCKTLQPSGLLEQRFSNYGNHDSQSRKEETPSEIAYENKSM
jgi:hypothetical protein